MYATFEADIENGVVKGYDATKLPSRAHVLITLLQEVPPRAPSRESKSLRGKLSHYADKALVSLEKSAWATAVMEKHEQS